MIFCTWCLVVEHITLAWSVGRLHPWSLFSSVIELWHRPPVVITWVQEIVAFPLSFGNAFMHIRITKKHTCHSTLGSRDYQTCQGVSQFSMRQGKPCSQEFPWLHLAISVNVVVEHPGLVLEQLAAVHLHRSWSDVSSSLLSCFSFPRGFLCILQVRNTNKSSDKCCLTLTRLHSSVTEKENQTAGVNPGKPHSIN